MARVTNPFKECNEQLKAFKREHETRMYDSGLCIEIWDQFTLYEELSGLLHEIFKMEFRIGTAKSFPYSILRHEANLKAHLKRLCLIMKKANTYCCSFWMVAKPEIENFDEYTLPDDFPNGYSNKWTKAEEEHESIMKVLKEEVGKFYAHIGGYNEVKTKTKMEVAANNLLKRLKISTFSVSKADKKDFQRFISARMTRRRLDETVCDRTKKLCMSLCTAMRGTESKSHHFMFFLSFYVLDIGRCLGTDIATLLLKRVEAKLEHAKYDTDAASVASNRKGIFSFLFPAKTKTFVFKYGDPEGLNVNIGNSIKFDTLGPFDAVLINKSIYQALALRQEGMELVLNVNKLSIRDQESVEGEGVAGDVVLQLSPKSKISLDTEARSSIMIPENATHYCFVYPATADTSGKKKELVQGDSDDAMKYNEPLLLLLFVGGYLYLDCRGEKETIVAATGLHSNGSHVHFGLPYLIKPEEEKYKQVQDMKKANRFQEVTLKVLLDMGVQRFAWFLPGELQKCDHGGFVYECRDDKDRKFYQYFNLVHTAVGTRLRAKVNERSTVTVKSDRDFQQLYENFFDDLPITRLKTKEEIALEEKEGNVATATMSHQPAYRQFIKGQKSRKVAI